MKNAIFRNAILGGADVLNKAHSDLMDKVTPIRTPYEKRKLYGSKTVEELQQMAIDNPDEVLPYLGRGGM